MFGNLCQCPHPLFAGLMGFVDPAPGAAAGGATKQLYIAYLHGGTVREAVFDDLSGIELPSAASRDTTSVTPVDGGGGVPSSGSSPSLSSRSPAGIRSASRAAGVRILPTDPPNGVPPSSLSSTHPAGSPPQPHHPVVEDAGRREWLLRQGAECLGLDLAALVAAVRDGSEEHM
jgi:hypothetical protein